LEVRDGRIEPVEKIRTRKKALNRLVELVIEKVGDQQPVYLAALHANAEEDARYVLDLAAEKLNAKETLITYVSAAVGTHTGPGTVGLVALYGYEFE